MTQSEEEKLAEEFAQRMIVFIDNLVDDYIPKPRSVDQEGVMELKSTLKDLGLDIIRNPK